MVLDATVATGAAAIMAIRVLLDHEVPPENILLLSLVMGESGAYNDGIVAYIPRTPQQSMFTCRITVHSQYRNIQKYKTKTCGDLLKIPVILLVNIESVVCGPTV